MILRGAPVVLCLVGLAGSCTPGGSPDEGASATGDAGPDAICDDGVCDALIAPQPAPSITQGITGVVGYRSDSCGAACCPCRVGAATLHVWSTAAALTDEATVRQTITTVAPLWMSLVEERYEHALDPGWYLGCAGDGQMVGPRCSTFRVDSGAVTTVNVRPSQTGASLTVFEPGTSAPRVDGRFSLRERPAR